MDWERELANAMGRGKEPGWVVAKDKVKGIELGNRLDKKWGN
jgi:hypothetical protein